MPPTPLPPGRRDSRCLRSGRPSGTTGAAATAAQRTRAALHLRRAHRLLSLTGLRAQHRRLKPRGKRYAWLPPAPRGCLPAGRRAAMRGRRGGAGAAR